MVSMAVQGNISVLLKPISTSSDQNLLLKPASRISIFRKPKTSYSRLCSSLATQFNYSSATRITVNELKVSSSSSSADQILEDDPTTLDSSAYYEPDKQKLGVVVKPMEKPRLVLKFIWMEKDIGIGLNQMIPGYGTIPLSPYYFWPRKDAWEELKILLESKPWIPEMQRIHLLNHATDIINLWQAGGGSLS